MADPNPRPTVVIPCPHYSFGCGPNQRGLHEVVLLYASALDAIAAMQTMEEMRYISDVTNG